MNPTPLLVRVHHVTRELIRSGEPANLLTPAKARQHAEMYFALRIPAVIRQPALQPLLARSEDGHDREDDVVTGDAAIVLFGEVRHLEPGLMDDAAFGIDLEVHDIATEIAFGAKSEAHEIAGVR